MKTTILTLLVCALFTITSCSRSANADILQINPEEAHKLAQSDDILIIDVRTPHEWRSTGIAKEAELVVLQDPLFIDKVIALIEANDGKDVAFICRTANRSMTAARWLKQHVDAPVYNVTEGMIGRTREDGWLARGLPTDTCCS